MNASLEWYYTFLVVARHQNFRKAAEELYLTQTTVFNHIRNLQDTLNIKLFERIGKNIRLTETGKQFLPIAEITINTYEKGIEAIQNAKIGCQYKIRLAVTPYICTYLMPKFLTYFFENAPHINIAMDVMDQQIPQKIDNGIYDIGIDRTVPVTTNVSYKKVCEGSIRLLVPNVKETENLKTELDFLNRYRILTDNHPVYWNTLKEDIVRLIPDSRLISIKSVDATESLIRANQGISYLPLYIVKNKRESSLRVIESQQIPAPLSFTYLMWKQEREEIITFLEMFEHYVRKEQV